METRRFGRTGHMSTIAIFGLLDGLFEHPAQVCSC